MDTFYRKSDGVIVEIIRMDDTLFTSGLIMTALIRDGVESPRLCVDTKVEHPTSNDFIIRYEIAGMPWQIRVGTYIVFSPDQRPVVIAGKKELRELFGAISVS